MYKNLPKAHIGFLFGMTLLSLFGSLDASDRCCRRPRKHHRSESRTCINNCEQAQGELDLQVQAQAQLQADIRIAVILLSGLMADLGSTGVDADQVRSTIGKTLEVLTKSSKQKLSQESPQKAFKKNKAKEKH